MIVSFHHQNKTKREREDAPHHQNKKRESTRQATTHTHTKSFTFKTKSELFSASDGGLEPTAAEQKKQCRSSPREKRMIISFHYQHKERKGDRVQPPTQREREGVSTAAKQQHTRKAVHHHN